MLMPKKNTIAIYDRLFQDGVMVAEKDFQLQSHPELEGVPNLQVIKACQSLKSRNYVTEQFAWRHYYWYLTNEGTVFLRDYLHIPSECVPATLLKKVKAEDTGSRRSAGPRTTEGKDERDAYRHAPQTDEKKDVGAGEGEFQFRGGFGRGKTAQ
ncbi:40S ribosomal protein S10-like isoform X2 [Varroa jacobsoni]|nr:40S ribosomal protein S10-like isoform X2 [Varroa destructor]XP_022665722.1 40S ribosomal protein S10-like isoform X2 [Varroa destructor]XP_022665731.1 40S ribosomal protein S10-like isoform X2 [Varroa destructor]XP_022704565.1 40S ribosomal protein S10-like isoform X2 [Varroa jacobsoni]XP_022704566.1 40S ribosomal protein S10-like isoform X2 [Varroa jacobsoni]XP_022704567.1 40S ribosomal protein S10-like isoform X2 [Varroa jacobsoni]